MHILGFMFGELVGRVGDGETVAFCLPVTGYSGGKLRCFIW